MRADDSSGLLVLFSYHLFGPRLGLDLIKSLRFVDYRVHSYNMHTPDIHCTTHPINDIKRNLR
jgi:hypothetical protein